MEHSGGHLEKDTNYTRPLAVSHLTPKTLPKKKKTDIIPLPLKFNTGVKQWQM